MLLRSPNTVALYDFGTSRDGGFYYVMELLDGIDLEKLVQQFGPQPEVLPKDLERVVDCLVVRNETAADPLETEQRLVAVTDIIVVLEKMIHPELGGKYRPEFLRIPAVTDVSKGFQMAELFMSTGFRR